MHALQLKTSFQSLSQSQGPSAPAGGGCSTSGKSLCSRRRLQTDWFRPVRGGDERQRSGCAISAWKSKVILHARYEFVDHLDSIGYPLHIIVHISWIDTMAAQADPRYSANVKPVATFKVHVVSRGVLSPDFLPGLRLMFAAFVIARPRWRWRYGEDYVCQAPPNWRIREKICRWVPQIIPDPRSWSMIPAVFLLCLLCQASEKLGADFIW